MDGSRCLAIRWGARPGRSRWGRARRVSTGRGTGRRVIVTDDMTRALSAAIASAREAGDLLARELHRPGGPRGAGDHAVADREAEQLIRDRLLAVAPGWGYTGEETGDLAPGSASCWVVDPNDGTSAFLRRERGSAVSIALLRDDVPVLGVVHAFAAPDAEGDLIAWAHGCGPITRNGAPVAAAPLATELDAHAVVLCGTEAERRWRGYAKVLAPSRFRAMPSIAYRLALVAVGDAEAALSLNGPCQWDFAAGHALVRAAGGELVDGHGQPVQYRDGRAHVSRCFSGHAALAAHLATRPWDKLLAGAAKDAAPTPPPRRRCSDAGRLARAQGCLLGQLAGDALGAQVEFQSKASIAREYPHGVRELRDGGHWDTLAGQPTDDSELALALARSLVREGAFAPDRVLEAYVAWYESDPFDVGTTTGAPLAAAAGTSGDVALTRAAAAAKHASEANGSLMRVSPIGVFAAGRPRQAAEWARADSALTHPNPVCQEACAAFAAAIAAAVGHGVDPVFAHDVAMREAARRPGRAQAVRQALERAKVSPRPDKTTDGWVLLALQNAFYHLLHTPSVEDALVATVGMGGDTDTTAAICGALLGAVHGRDAIPLRWRSLVLSCRSAAEAGAHRPRPRTYWPIDALELAESLLAAGDGFTDHVWPDPRAKDAIWRPDPSGTPRLDMATAVAIASERLEQERRHAATRTSLAPAKPDRSPRPGLRVACGGVVFDGDGRIALVKPAGGFGGYAWTFPKGRPDADEHPVAAARREVREEAGIEAVVEWLIPHRFHGTTSETIYFLMRAERSGLPHDAETAEVRWATPVEATKLIGETTHATGRTRDLAVLAAALEADQTYRACVSGVCSICGAQALNPGHSFPRRVCADCEARARNAAGEPAWRNYQWDEGDNPVFIDGIRCWRVFRFGDCFTMRDELGCDTEEAFHATAVQLDAPARQRAEQTQAKRTKGTRSPRKPRSRARRGPP
jgi:ADP-ribosyl-[dinitrogen reductase] hydrolase